MKEHKRFEIAPGIATLVSSDTFERLKLNMVVWKPCINARAGKTYVQGYNGVQSVFMHRVITGAQKGQIVDHINGDPLDNRDENLRIVTAAHNRANSRRDKDNRSGYKGVTWAKSSRKWMAQIVAHGRKYYLGVFSHIKRAAIAHDAAAKAIWGEFAGLNFPDRKTRAKLPANYIAPV